MTSVLVLALSVISNVAAGTESARISPPLAADYTMMWWAKGWQKDREPGKRIRNIQTGYYAMGMDVDTMQILHLGPVLKAKTYEFAVQQDNSTVFELPPAALEMVLTVDGKRYRCASGKHPRLIDSGRFVQRGDVVGLTFADTNGVVLGTKARLEITAWPETISFMLEAGPGQSTDQSRLRASEKNGKGSVVVQEGKWRSLSMDLNLDYAGRRYSAKEILPAGEVVSSGDLRKVTLTLKPAIPNAGAVRPDPAVNISAMDLVANKPVKVEWRAANSWYFVDMRTKSPKKQAGDYIDSVRFRLMNDSDREVAVPICFDQTPARNVVGISPLLRELDGTPTGIPIQISKDWHDKLDGAPYNGSWLHAFALLRLPARSTVEYRLDLAHAYWGSLPAVSHAQLCLLGFGGDQQWDQVAIGSWGESICYDPDVNLGRSMIDDVRPMMVNGKSGAKWDWSNNIGGGDFLVYYDESGKRCPLVRMKTAYLKYCPVMTEVVYAGVSADQAIEARLTVSTPRSADFPRHFHRVRYDVRKAVKFKRLAFYQVGADRYNENWYSKIARGSADGGVAEEWDITRASGKYDRIGMAAVGSSPWFSFHAVDRVDDAATGRGGAARGLIVREWKARLGGKDVPVPFFSVYGAKPSAVLELGVPPGVEELLPGDYVEAALEYIILPAAAGEYYGPDDCFRKALSEAANTWKPVHREALVGNDFKVNVTTGTLQKRFPLDIAAVKDKAEFAVVGAIGYVPVTISGLSDYRGPLLEVREDGRGEWQKVANSVQDRNFWQTDYDTAHKAWSMTFTVPPDAADDAKEKREFRFRLQ